MKYCPECESEYRDDIELCADCEVLLIAAEDFFQIREKEELVRETLAKEEFVPVKVAENSFEVDTIKAALEQEGIPVLVRLFEDTAYDGIYVAQKGWGYVEVPQSDKGKAEKIIDDISLAFLEQQEDNIVQTEDY